MTNLKSRKSAEKPLPPGKVSSLTELERKFSECYLKSLNATQAYLEVRPQVKRSTAEANGHRLLRKAEVAEYLEKRRLALQATTDVCLEKVVQELAKIAFFDPRALFDDAGCPIPIHELDEATAAAVMSVEVASSDSASEGHFRVLRYKYVDKNYALDKLMKHLGGYTSTNGQQGHSLVEAMKAARSLSENRL